MWHPFFQLIAGIITWMADTFFPDPSSSGVNAIGSLMTSLPDGVISTVSGGLGIIGCFVDIQVLFACVSVVLVWRGIWVAYRIYRIIKDAIPVIG